MSWRISVTRSCRPAARSSRMRRTWVSIERRRARVSASMPAASPSRDSSRRATRSWAAAMRSRTAPSRAGGLGARLRQEGDELAEPGLGLSGAGGAALDDVAEIVDLLGGLADDGEDVGGGQRLLGVDAGDAELGDRGEPLLELAVEAVLGMAGEELEQAYDERAGEAEQRGAEGGAHAAELALEAAHQRVEAGHGAAALLRGERADGVDDGGDDGGETVEGAEQAEEDEKRDDVAGEVALLLDAGGD